MKLKTMKLLLVCFVEIFELKSCQLYFGFGKKRKKNFEELENWEKKWWKQPYTAINNTKEGRERERVR